MIKLLTEQDLEKVFNALDISIDVRKELINYDQKMIDDPDSNKCIKYYHTLTIFSEYLSDKSKTELFYNRYYWFKLLKHTCEKRYIKSVSLDQYEFKLLEEAGNLEDINWNEVEGIMNYVKYF